MPLSKLGATASTLRLTQTLKTFKKIEDLYFLVVLRGPLNFRGPQRFLRNKNLFLLTSFFHVLLNIEIRGWRSNGTLPRKNATYFLFANTGVAQLS